ncbi:permease [Rhodovulum sulfidophilum]|uniref:Permease n=1 Tax=Rhodovulum sulfidophilum TaxID=35806 RepID=A0A0D6B2K5_RHOSU|nr:permease [Rhodovulum sulfidophilum]
MGRTCPILQGGGGLLGFPPGFERPRVKTVGRPHNPPNLALSALHTLGEAPAKQADPGHAGVSASKSARRQSEAIVARRPCP